MKLDFSNPLDKQKGITYFKKLLEGCKNVELKALMPKRTIKQNSYLHVIISLYSITFGYTLLEAKTDLKRECSFMRYEKNGNWYLKETSKLTTKELTDFIEWIRNYSSNDGLYLPTPEEYLSNKFSIDKEIDNHKQYL